MAGGFDAQRSLDSDRRLFGDPVGSLRPGAGGWPSTAALGRGHAVGHSTARAAQSVLRQLPQSETENGRPRARRGGRRQRRRQGGGVGKGGAEGSGGTHAAGWTAAAR